MRHLQTYRLRFRYPAQPHWALDGVDLEIRRGQVTWLTGALGSGTSTTLLALAGLAPRLTGGERQGEVRIGTDDPGSLNPLAAGIAYLGSSPALQLSGIARTVRDEIAVGPMNLGWTREQIDRVVERAMEQLEIRHLADRAPDSLSGGETQAVLLASMASVTPKIWLLDEPFSALDRSRREIVSALLRRVAREGATVVVASDDADTMASLADRLVVFAGGKVVLDGNPGPLLADSALLRAGAGTTDASTLAALAGWPPPRPLDSSSLLALVRAERASLPAPLLRVEESSAEPREPILSLEKVSFAYRVGIPVLKEVSLRVGPGEAVGIFGANGAGKSTLLRLAMALEHPREGRVVTLGRSTAGLFPEDFAPRTGFLFQQPEHQLFAPSVRGECALALRLAGWAGDPTEAAVAEVLGELGLSDVADENPYDLPLPRRRLVAFASILVAVPELVLLDEPTAGLDSKSRDLVIDVIRKRVAGGMAAVVITHDAILAHETLDRAVELREGAMIADGPAREVLMSTAMTQPAALAVALELGVPAGQDRRRGIASLLSRIATTVRSR